MLFQITEDIYVHVYRIEFEKKVVESDANGV